MKTTSCGDTGTPLPGTPGLATSPMLSGGVFKDAKMDDWVEVLLAQDARSASVSTDDTVFVAQLMGRLTAEELLIKHAEGFSVSLWSRRLTLGFVGLVAVALYLATPSALQAWLELIQLPLQASSWHKPQLWGFMAGLAMLAFGTLELVHTWDATESEAVPALNASRRDDR